MIYYSSHPGTTNPNHEKILFFKKHGIRLMVSSAAYQRPILHFALDSGAWYDYVHKSEFNHPRFIHTLDRIYHEPIQPDFIIIPDIVAGGLKSLELSKKYLYLTDDYPCYLPVQDGMQPNDIDGFGNISGLFVGGSTNWKWNTAAMWARYAHDNNIMCHIGRVGTQRNFQRAVSAKADSSDGSALIRNGKHHLIPLYLKATLEQKLLDCPLRKRQ